MSLKERKQIILEELEKFKTGLWYRLQIHSDEVTITQGGGLVVFNDNFECNNADGDTFGTFYMTVSN